MSPESQDALVSAIKSGDANRVRELLDSHPHLLKAGVTDAPSLLLLALYHGQPELAELLLEKGAEVDIFEAAALGIRDRAQELVGANPSLVNAYNRDGFQPLGLASFFARSEVVSLLLERGADVNAPSDNGMKVMPLHSAVAARSVAIAQQLLARGADVNARQQSGYTPLHAAAQNGQVEMVDLLLQAGASTTVAAGNGATPGDLAVKFGHIDIANRLEPKE